MPCRVDSAMELIMCSVLLLLLVFTGVVLLVACHDVFGWCQGPTAGLPLVLVFLCNLCIRRGKRAYSLNQLTMTTKFTRPHFLGPN